MRSPLRVWNLEAVGCVVHASEMSPSVFRRCNVDVSGFLEFLTQCASATGQVLERHALQKRTLNIQRFRVDVVGVAVILVAVVTIHGA